MAKNLIKQHKHEILFLAILTAIRLTQFYYIYIHNQLIPLKGDMWTHMEMLIYLKKFYYPFKIWSYPILYLWIWSLPLHLPIFSNIRMLLSYIIAIAIINSVMCIWIYFMLAKKLFKKSCIAIFSCLLWLFISDFSWLYIFIEDLSKCKTFYGCLIIGLERMGVYSGLRYSQTFLDDHVLIRLFSFNLLLIGLYVLLSINETKSRKYYIIFALIYGLTLGGHVIEGMLLTLAMVVMLFLVNFSRNDIILFILVTSVAGTIAHLVNFVFTSLGNQYPLNILYTLVCFSMPVSIAIITILKRIFMKIINYINKFHINTYFLKKIILATFIYFYGLGLVTCAEVVAQKGLGWQRFTHWYFIPFDWGFIGLLTVVSIVLISKYKWYSWGLKFIILYLILLGMMLISINLINYYIIFIITPNYVEPVYFIPFLSMISGHLILLWKKNKFSKILLSIIIILSFSIGSVSMFLNMQYWKLTSGRYLNQRISWTTADLELAEFLYKASSKYGFIVSSEDYTSPYSYIMKFGGFTYPHKPFNLLYQTICSEEEFYLLYNARPVDYILIYKKTSNKKFYSIIRNMSKNKVKICFINKKYIVYKIINNSNITKHLVDKFIAVESIVLNGTGIIISNNSKTTIIAGIYVIKPLKNGLILLITHNESIYILNNPFIIFKGNVSFIKVYSYGYFFEYAYSFCTYAERISILGESQFHIFNSFCNKRIYLEKINYIGSCYIEKPQTIREKIICYAKDYWISPMSAIKTSPGITWTILYIVLMDLILFKKIKLPKLKAIVIIKVRQSQGFDEKAT